MDWDIEFFNEEVKQEALELPKGIKAKSIHILELVKSLGPYLGMPHTRPMGDGLFEIRAKGKEGIGRIFVTAHPSLRGQERSEGPKQSRVDVWIATPRFARLAMTVARVVTNFLLCFERETNHCVAQFC